MVGWSTVAEIAETRGWLDGSRILEGMMLWHCALAAMPLATWSAILTIVLTTLARSRPQSKCGRRVVRQQLAEDLPRRTGNGDRSRGPSHALEPARSSTFCGIPTRRSLISVPAVTRSSVMGGRCIEGQPDFAWALLVVSASHAMAGRLKEAGKCYGKAPPGRPAPSDFQSRRCHFSASARTAR